MKYRPLVIDMQSFSLKLSLVEYFDSRNKNALEKDISCQPLVKDESKFNRQKNINKDLHQNNEIIWIFKTLSNLSKTIW